jgi:hypothetical protein
MIPCPDSSLVVFAPARVSKRLEERSKVEYPSLLTWYIMDLKVSITESSMFLKDDKKPRRRKRVEHQKDRATYIYIWKRYADNSNNNDAII